MGGREAILAVRSLIIEGAGRGFYVGQGRSPDDGTLPYRITGLRREIDLANGRWRQTQTVTPEWAAQRPEADREITAVDGVIGFDVGDDGVARRQSPAIGLERRTELRQSVLGVLQLALSPGAEVSNLRRDGAHDVIDVRAPDGQLLMVALDRKTRLPVSVAARTHEDTIGDVTVETEFAGYQTTAGLKLPRQLTSKLERQVVVAVQVSNTVNGDIAELAVPPQVRASTAPATPATRVTTDELAPGVWRLAGGPHVSVVVELADRLILIEAPVSDARTLAVLSEARGLRPSLPLTHVVCTHHHWDHVGGIRAAVSEGLTVIAHERNKPFLQRLVDRQRSIAPDALAPPPAAPKLETVKTKRTIDDPVRPVEIYTVATAHADTMLVVYLPREQLLIEADLYTPAPPNSPALANPYAGELIRVIETNRLRVDRVVPLHRDVVPFSALVEAANPSPSKR